MNLTGLLRRHIDNPEYGQAVVRFGIGLIISGYLVALSNAGEQPS
jgi:hypothetical protein